MDLSKTEILTVSQANFQSEVVSSDLPVLVDFTAAWCGPCKMLDPIVTQLAQEWGGKVKVVKLDVDDNSDLAMQYQVMGVPTLILFVKGQPVQRVTGYQPKDRIVSRLSLTPNQPPTWPSNRLTRATRDRASSGPSNGERIHCHLRVATSSKVRGTNTATTGVAAPAE